MGNQDLLLTMHVPSPVEKALDTLEGKRGEGNRGARAIGRSAPAWIRPQADWCGLPGKDPSVLFVLARPPDDAGRTNYLQDVSPAWDPTPRTACFSFPQVVRETVLSLDPESWSGAGRKKEWPHQGNFDATFKGTAAKGGPERTGGDGPVGLALPPRAARP
jgi:hypothetical protein